MGALPGAFDRVFATVLRALLVRLFVAPPLAAEPEATALRSASLMAPLRAEGFLSVPELEAAGVEAAARRDAGSAAATDGLSEQSVFGRGTEIGSPSASPPLEPVPTITATRSRVLGDGATFQCTTLHCNDADRAGGRSITSVYRTRPSAAAAAAPTIPASLRNAAATTGVRHSRRGTHLSAFLLTPPPAMMRSGQIRSSRTCR